MGLRTGSRAATLEISQTRQCLEYAPLIKFVLAGRRKASPRMLLLARAKESKRLICIPDKIHESRADFRLPCSSRLDNGASTLPQGFMRR